MRKNRKAKGIIVIIAGIMLIMSAIALWLYNYNEDQNAQQAVDMAHVLLDRIVSVEDVPVKPSAAPKEQEDADDVPEMSVFKQDDYWYIGVIYIADLDLSLPVMADWDYSRLKIAPCRYSGSVYEDTLVIAAHNYRSHFGNIDSLQTGSEVTFTDSEGSVFTYEVVVVETLESDDIRRMIRSEYDLTLFTCTYGGVSRVTVRCVRVSDMQGVDET